MTDDPIHAQVRRMADLAWAAGVLDGGGQWVAMPRKTKNGQSYTMRLRLRRGLGDRLLLEDLQRVLGGAIGNVEGRVEWHLSGAKTCLAVHEQIRPYLRHRARRAQAHAAICQRIVDFQPSGLDRTVPADELRERESLVNAARASGVVVSPMRERRPMPAGGPDDGLPF